MQTIPQTPTPCKAFYAHLHDVSGILTKVADEVLFMAYDTGAMTTVTSTTGLTVLGEVGFADAQQLLDVLHGGYAAHACQRSMEVA